MFIENTSLQDAKLNENLQIFESRKYFKELTTVKIPVLIRIIIMECYNIVYVTHSYYTLHKANGTFD